MNSNERKSCTVDQLANSLDSSDLSGNRKSKVEEAMEAGQLHCTIRCIQAVQR